MHVAPFPEYEAVTLVLFTSEDPILFHKYFGYGVESVLFCRCCDLLDGFHSRQIYDFVIDIGKLL